MEDLYPVPENFNCIVSYSLRPQNHHKKLHSAPLSAILSDPNLQRLKHLTSSPMCGRYSKRIGGQNTWLCISMILCLSLRESRLSTAFSMMSSPSWRDVSRLYSADK